MREALSPVLSPGSSRGAGSGTWRNSGIENTTHHTATITAETWNASIALDNPKVRGLAIIQPLSANSRPPPR